jgi:hypothetical protein
MVILAIKGGYLVGWGSEQVRDTVTLRAFLRDGGNPGSADGWVVSTLAEE